MKINLFIDNKDVETNDYSEVRDPGRLSEIVGYVAKGKYSDVDRAVNVAHQAFLKWRKLPLDERISLLLKAADRIEEEVDVIAEVTSKENGMLLEVTKAELGVAAAGIRNIVSLADSFFKSEQLEDETSEVIIDKKPMGVIAGIVPWNAPMILTMQKLAPALVAGNTIVFKPSPTASIGVTVVLKKIAEIFPPGVINIVHGDADIGEALTTHPLIRKISFTGGGPIAKHVMRAAADSLKSIHFELGGNDPAIILNDAKLDEIVPAITNAVFRRSGQYCYAIKRIYIPSAMYDDFYEIMYTIADKYKIGHQLNPESTFGPINSQNQFENIKALINRMKDNQTNMVELGEQIEPDNWENGYYLRPIIARDVDHNEEIVTCEQFGPITPLISYDSEEDVIKMANDSEYGLGSSVWSSDVERALRVAKEIEAGMTFINGAGQTQLGYKFMPFGGVKQSGIGRENSKMVFDEYVETHAINIHK